MQNEDQVKRTKMRFSVRSKTNKNLARRKISYLPWIFNPMLKVNNQVRQLQNKYVQLCKINVLKQVSKWTRGCLNVLMCISCHSEIYIKHRWGICQVSNFSKQNIFFTSKTPILRLCKMVQILLFFLFHTKLWLLTESYSCITLTLIVKFCFFTFKNKRDY